jgi:hypothetical protein
VASSTKPKLLRRALALGASACLLVVVASAGAETAPGAEAHVEATAVTDATTVATGQFVALAEGIGVGDGTGSLAGQALSLGEAVGVGDAHDTLTGQVVGVTEGVGISDGTDTTTGQAVQIGEGIAVGDGTEAEGMNAPPTVLVAALTGDEGSAATGAGSFADPDSVSWTATVDYGDGTPAQPLALQPDKTFELSHVYDDDGAYLVTVTVTDGQGESGSATAAVTIANVAPEATLADAAGEEGSPITVALTDPHDPSAADTAAGFTYRFACDGASLGAETASPTTQCTFDDDGTYTVLTRIADKDGGQTDYTADVVVANVAPTAELANDGPVAEGSPATISWNGASDASAADTAAGFTYRYACDGATLGPETSDATASCTFDDGPASHTVLARIADKDGGFTDYTTVVAVENAPPDGTLANDGPVAESGSVTISWADQSDPSTTDTAAGFTYSYACDGVTLGAPTSDPTATCTFDDGPAAHTVLARITDKDGGSTDRTTVVEVTNLPPTATLGNDGPVAEGTPVAVAFADQADPSQADAAAGFTYRYACDGVTLGAPTADPATTCAFDDGPATHTVLARITDKDGGHADYTTDVEVTNVAPTATLVTPAQPTDEGSSFTLALADASDPSAADTAAGFTIEFDCGTGAGFAAEATCVALDDPSQAVRARIADKDGGETILTADVAVANVAPSVAITGPPSGSLYRVGEPVTFTGTFTDPGAADTHTASWSFDGAAQPGAVTEAGGSGSVSLVTSFAAAGVYAVELTVTDDDGGAGTATTVDGLPAFVVVYDPSAGFVTGGGWIMSPPGAYAPDPAATGKATFGFVARYKPGAHVPSGNTEFHFKAARFDFKATSYEWLVVAGSKAQYRGAGTVNGEPGYGFVLTAYDDDPDRLRLKVWDAAHAVVYDNRQGASDDLDAADPQAIGGGSIVVHRR